jgi:putative acetyltransferase
VAVENRFASSAPEALAGAAMPRFFVSHLMSNDIVIRPERADHPQVVVLLGALDVYLATLYEPEANHILTIDELLAPEVSLFAAWHGDRIVGTGAVRHMAGEPETGGVAYGEVKRMYVEPSSRGLGIAWRMLVTLEQTLRAQRLGWALLETGRDQREAVRLYERCGYQRRGPFAGYADNGLSLFYAKALAA